MRKQQQQGDPHEVVQLSGWKTILCYFWGSTDLVDGVHRKNSLWDSLVWLRPTLQAPLSAIEPVYARVDAEPIPDECGLVDVQMPPPPPERLPRLPKGALWAPSLLPLNSAPLSLWPFYRILITVLVSPLDYKYQVFRDFCFNSVSPKLSIVHSTYSTLNAYWMNKESACM